jgi:hypothetical protein
MLTVKTATVSKTDLLKILRDSDQQKFEVIEPVTPESLGRILPELRKRAGEAAYLSLVVVPKH